MAVLEDVKRPETNDFVTIANTFAAECAKSAADRDNDDSFVAENYEKLKKIGLIDAGVPVELGGGGADVRMLTEILRTLAHGCSSTALALSMHTHQVAFPAWRWHHQEATRDKTEPLLKRIAAEKLVLLSSGGGDWIGGSGKAEPVDGGYKITARKMFVSGAPKGDILMTSAVSPEDGGTVIHFPCPMAAPEVSVLDTWHTMGMRGTGSHDVMIEGLFVPSEKIPVKRPAGQWHPLFFMLGTIAFPIIYSVYVGVAERARDIAVGIAKQRPASEILRDRAGRVENALTGARLALEHMIQAVELNAPSVETVNQVMTGRRLVEDNAIAAVEAAMELAGGAGFYRKAELERAFRDIQAARYHPLQKEVQTQFTGALALDQDITTIY